MLNTEKNPNYFKRAVIIVNQIMTLLGSFTHSTSCLVLILGQKKLQQTRGGLFWDKVF